MKNKITLFVALGLMFISAASFAQTEGMIAKADALVKESIASYDSIQSYEAMFERDFNEEITKPGEKIFMRFEKPLNIFMSWKSGKTGQQIVYAEGLFEDKMLVRPPGFLFSFIPIVHLDTDDPRVAEGEDHSIQSAGVGHFVESFSEDFITARERGLIEILDVAPMSVEGEEGTAIEVMFGEMEGINYPYVKVVYSNKHHLPIQINLAKAKGETEEVYRYIDLKANIAREAGTLKSNMDRRLAKFYTQIPETN